MKDKMLKKENRRQYLIQKYYLDLCVSMSVCLCVHKPACVCMCVYMSEVFFLPHLLVFLPPGLITSFHLRYLGHRPVPEECLQDVILGGLGGGRSFSTSLPPEYWPWKPKHWVIFIDLVEPPPRIIDVVVVHQQAQTWAVILEVAEAVQKSDSCPPDA